MSKLCRIQPSTQLRPSVAVDRPVAIGLDTIEGDMLETGYPGGERDEMPKGGPINPEQELAVRVAVLSGRLVGLAGVALNGGEAQDCGSLVSVKFRPYDKPGS